MAAIDEKRQTSKRTLKLGIAGLGVGSAMVIPTVQKMEEIELIAAADVRPDALKDFEQRYGGKGYETVEALCNDPNVDIVWVATPNPYHCPHVIMAAEHGKHIVCEKPMALSVAECEKMVEAADKAKVKMLCGHTYSLNKGIQEMRRIVKSGQLGKPIQIMNFLYSDWLLKPRMPWEYDVSQGGGVVYRHGPHIIDTIRTLGGGMVRSVRAQFGMHLPERPAPGNYTAFIEFEDGTPASISYNGYGYFNSSDLVWGIGDRMYTMEQAVAVRKGLRSGELDVEKQKEDLRAATRAGGADAEAARSNRVLSSTGSWFGVFITSCERGAIRQSPNGLYVYDDEGMHEVEVKNDGEASGSGSGNTELRELYEAILDDKPLKHDGRWGMATLEVIESILRSGRERKEIMMSHQVPTPD